MSPDGTVLLYRARTGLVACDVLCGRCKHGRYIEPHEPDVTKMMAALWLEDHYQLEHPHWHRLAPQFVHDP